MKELLSKLSDEELKAIVLSDLPGIENKMVALDILLARAHNKGFEHALEIES